MIPGDARVAPGAWACCLCLWRPVPGAVPAVPAARAKSRRAKRDMTNPAYRMPAFGLAAQIRSCNATCNPQVAGDLRMRIAHCPAFAESKLEQATTRADDRQVAFPCADEVSRST